MRADSAVEPTRSENITVTWRRSARSSGKALGALDVVAASATEDLPPASVRRAAIASRILRRCPTMPTPKSFRSSAVKFGRTVSSISFSRNAASYFPRPRLRSQAPMSMSAPQTQGYPHIIVQPGEGVQNARKESPRPRSCREAARRSIGVDARPSAVEPVNQPRNGFSVLPSSSQKLAL